MATRTIDNWKENRHFVTPADELLRTIARKLTILFALVVPDKSVIGLFSLQGLA